MDIITSPVREHELICLEKFYNPEEIVLFDIETTGFIAESTVLYLIGCCYFSDNKWYIKQWFNDDVFSESVILKDFISFISKYKYIMHYNGDGFDIPYIIKKLTKFNIAFDFSKIISLDLYKNIKPLKKLLHTENLKQKSIENYLGINRLDKYSGGDLIKVYQNYIKSSNPAERQLLLQHNYEDLEGLLYCSCLISFTKLNTGCITVKKMSVKSNRLIFNIQPDYSLPKRITFGNGDITITAFQNDCTITVPIISEELKFFFENYKDYYYLPVEDIAVHKSIANFVDKDYRNQAKKETCYYKKKGFFISQFDSGIISGYKRDYKDKETFIELNDAFLQDLDMLTSYARYIISKLMF